MALILVPADPLRPRRPDEHFAPEVAAARDAGHDVALIDHDALAEPYGAERAVARVPGGGGAAVYRGWMLTGSQYAALADALAAKGVTLRTSAEQYRQAHELPGWYPALASVTPAAAWTAGDGRAGVPCGVRAPRSGPGGAARLRQVDEAVRLRGMVPIGRAGGCAISRHWRQVVRAWAFYSNQPRLPLAVAAAVFPGPYVPDPVVAAARLRQGMLTLNWKDPC